MAALSLRPAINAVNLWILNTENGQNQMPFPLRDVQIKFVKEIPQLPAPVYSGNLMQVSHDHCRIEIPGIGVFLMVGGHELRCTAGPGIDRQLLETYLQGLPVAALLHQRRVLHFHAASFVYQEKGVMVLGQSGAGKSSLAAAFHLDGASVLSDDITALQATDGMPAMMPVNVPIRLRQGILTQLAIDPHQVEGTNSFTGKVTLKTGFTSQENHPLHLLVYLEKYNGQQILTDTPAPEEQFALLRSEICHWEMLRGMPGTEQKYFSQILNLLKSVPFLRIRRPENGHVVRLFQFLKNYCESGQKNE